MKLFRYLPLTIFILSYSMLAQISVQTPQFVTQIGESYTSFKEQSLKERRIKHNDLQPLINELKNNPVFEVQKVGESIEGRDLRLISVGEGETDVFLWSQMHGDESTATMAFFDIFNFINSGSFQKEKDNLYQNIKLHFLPMLNPDGAEKFHRRNALGIDVNRDALRLQSPEAQTLKRIRDSLEADCGFNLHDQSKYYNAETTANPATISFLAPAFNYEKEINDVRGDAMKLIIAMNRQLQQIIPGQVAKYNDDFEPRAFGDNIQKWGTSTILIESGGYLNDPEKQKIRKLNFIAILSALFSISNKDYKDLPVQEYEQIPENDSKLFDLKLTGLNYELLGKDYILDLGINYLEINTEDNNYYYRGQIADLGDLSTNYGYISYDLAGYKIIPGEIYPETINNLKEVEKLDFQELLQKGYSYVKVEKLSGKTGYTKFPVQIVKENFIIPHYLSLGTNPTFFLERNGKREYVVVNGYLIDLNDPKDDFRNGLIIN